MEFGEKKYAGAGDYPVDIKLTGEDLGTFTFDIEQISGDKVAATTTFADIPVMRNMTTTLSVAETVSEMQIDVEGDGQNDFTFHSGEKIKPEQLLDIFEKIINLLKIKANIKNQLVDKVDSAKKQMEKGHIISANAMLENVKHQIETFSREQTPEKFRIYKDEAEKLIKIVNRIQALE